MVETQSKNRKTIKVNEDEYEILKTLSEKKHIPINQVVRLISKEYQKAQISEYEKLLDEARKFCDLVEAMVKTHENFPEWVKKDILMTLKPVILSAIIKGNNIDFEGIKSVWDRPQEHFIIVTKKN